MRGREVTRGGLTQNCPSGGGGSPPSRSRRGTGSGRGRSAASRRARPRSARRSHVAALNGCGTHGLPRSASYSTTTNAAARPEVRRRAPRTTVDLPVARDEMEAVGRDQAVERGQVQRAGRGRATSVVSRSPGSAPRPPPRSSGARRASRSTATIRPPGPSRSARARVNAPSPAPMSAHVAARLDRRRGAGRRDRAWSTPLAGVLEPGRDPVDGELDEAEQALALRVVGRQRPQPGEQPDLQLRQRVDVRVAQRDRPPQDRLAVEQPLAAGDAQRASATVRRYSASIAAQRRRRSSPGASAAYWRATPMSARARDSSALSRRLARNGHAR